MFVALDDIAIFGTLVARSGTAGGAASTPLYQRGGGAGGGTAVTQGGHAGSGASFCGLGGRGASSGPEASPPPPPAYGTPEIVPLVGGSAGGIGFFGSSDDARGGGVFHLVGGKSVLVASGGAISVPGAGGVRGSTQIGGPGRYAGEAAGAAGPS